MVNRKALGRGLQALIPEEPVKATTPKESNIQFVDVAKVSPNPFQPRLKFDPEKLDELKASIKENGVIQPITIRPFDDGFQLIAGERRLRAVKDLAFESIPAYILDIQTDEEMMELSIIENIHREDLNPIDIAVGYKRLVDECHLTQEEVAHKVGKDRTTITNFMRLLKLPKEIRSSVEDGSVTMGHARALLSVSEKSRQIEIWKKIINNELSVRKVEQLVKPTAKPQKKEQQPPDKNSYLLEDMEHQIRNRLTTKVRIKSKRKGGSIEIDYYDYEDLDRIMSLICDIKD
jgi:ParB family transcriptional regulator, chromosome partitioning protein